MTPEPRDRLSIALSPESAAPAEANHPARSLAQLENSQAAMRDATKWLVAAAAAVGAVLVAGLQLKDLPYGTKAGLVAYLGVLAALSGVAFILYRAADVLVAGYTTFGRIVDLAKDDKYLRQQVKAEKWDLRIDRYKAKRRRSRSIISYWWFGLCIQLLNVARGFAVRHAKDEDIQIGELISYLNRDTFFFTQGLAVNINQLYGALRAADEEILSLRGEEVGEEEEWEEEGSDPASSPQAAIEAVLPPPEPTPHISPDPSLPVAYSPDEVASADDSQALLEKAEWRRDRLEDAMGVLIYFANQRLLEKRFRKLLKGILYGGIAVAVGAGAFAVAPQLGKPKPLSITQPTRVTVTVVSIGMDGLCPPGTVLHGVAVGGTWQDPVVVTEAMGRCPAQPLTVDHGQAVVVPVLGTSPSASATP